jgi:hypothetical protein
MLRDSKVPKPNEKTEEEQHHLITFSIGRDSKM